MFFPSNTILIICIGTLYFDSNLIIGPEKMKKIGFAFAQNKIWEIGMAESKLVFRRKLEGEDEQLIMFR